MERKAYWLIGAVLAMVLLAIVWVKFIQGDNEDLPAMGSNAKNWAGGIPAQYRPQTDTPA
jgi:hypothetical protein